MKCAELIQIASDSYGDEMVCEAFRAKVDGHSWEGDTLAKFIASDLAETFETEPSTKKQLARAIEVMTHASNDITAVIEALQRSLELEDQS